MNRTNMSKNIYLIKEYGTSLFSLINSILLLVLMLTENTKFGEIFCFTCNNIPPFIGKITISYAGFTTSVMLLILSYFTKINRIVFCITSIIAMIGVSMSSYLISYQILAYKNICKLCFFSSCLFLLILVSLLYDFYNRNIITSEQRSIIKN